MLGLSHASAASLALACAIAGVLAFAVGVAATVAIRRFAKGHHLRMDRAHDRAALRHGGRPGRAGRRITRDV